MPFGPNAAIVPTLAGQKVTKAWPKPRAALKGTNLRGQTPICGFLRVPAVLGGFLRKAAVFCENLRLPNALFSKKRRESAEIRENLRESAFGFGLSPQVCPLKRALKIIPNC